MCGPQRWRLAPDAGQSPSGRRRAPHRCLRTGERRGGRELRGSRLLPEHVAAELLRHQRLQLAPLPGTLPGHPLPAESGGPREHRGGRAARCTVGHLRPRNPASQAQRDRDGREGRSRSRWLAAEPAPKRKVPAPSCLQPGPKRGGRGTRVPGARGHVTRALRAGPVALFTLARRGPPSLGRRKS